MVIFFRLPDPVVLPRPANLLLLTNLLCNLTVAIASSRFALGLPLVALVAPVIKEWSRAEKEFVVDSGANMHKVSRKDLNSAELDTVKVSKNPTTVMTANSEVQTKEEATVYVREMDLFVTVMLLEDATGSSFTWRTLRRSRAQLPLDQWSETTSHQKRQERSYATRRTTYPSVSLVYRQAFQAHLHLHSLHFHRRKP